MGEHVKKNTTFCFNKNIDSIGQDKRTRWAYVDPAIFFCLFIVDCRGKGTVHPFPWFIHTFILVKCPLCDSQGHFYEKKKL